MRTWLVLLMALCAWPPAAAGDAPREDPDEVTFVVMGHLRGDDNGRTNPWLDTIVEEVGRLEPDLVVLTGDTIWGDFNSAVVDGEEIVRDWEAVDAALARLGVPIYRVPGNHDVNDETTRRIFLERYGELPRRVDVGPVCLLLLDSTEVGEPSPDGTMPVPRDTIGGKPIDAEQRAFIQRELAAEPQPDHAFLFLHHILWWSGDAPWWREVHPLLVGTPVRAVFGGDYGPMKFSHVERDGIDYIQSAIEGLPSKEMLGTLESTRLLTQQFDTVVRVSVRGDEARITVHPVAATVSGKYSPAFRKSLYDYTPPLSYRLEKLLARPGLLLAGAGGLLLVFLAGFVVARFLAGGTRV